jgi:hypothetical protein
MKYEVIVSDTTGFYAFDTIVERWKVKPKMFPFDQRGAIIPQNVIPDWLRADKEGLFNFYSYICLYMRGGIESLQAFKAMVKLRTDKPELFDPFYAQHLKQEELQPIIAEYIGWDSKAVTRFWIENSKRLVRNWDGKASNIFKGLISYEEALRRIKNKKTKKEYLEACKIDDRCEGFMGFQPKMVSMLIYFIDWEGLLEVQFIYPTPADFHNFRFGLALRILILNPQPENLRSTEKISKPWRDLTVRYLEARKGKVTPVELADAIWLFSLTLCGNSPLTDYHEREDNNGYGLFSFIDLPHTVKPSFLTQKMRGRLERTCLSCPLIDSCELAIPAGPYYQRREDREVAFGGQLYLWDRFPVEWHLPTFEIDYMPPVLVETNEELPQIFDDLHEQRGPKKPTKIPEHLLDKKN